MEKTTNAEHARGRAGIFSADAALLALAVGLLPNALYLLAMPLFVASRPISPLLYLIAGISALFLPRRFMLPLVLLVAAIDLGLLVMIAFHLPLGTALQSLRYIASIDLSASAFYIAVISLHMGTAVVLAWILNRNRDRFRSASPTLATLLVVALCGADMVANAGPHPTQTDFTSAVAASGLARQIETGTSNDILLVLVEGLGAFSNGKDSALLTAAFEPIVKSGAYRLTSGTVPYDGSTTAAEARELCGMKGNHLDMLAGGERPDCLPFRLRKLGYQTSTFHGFDASMFERDLWYPRIGFEHLNFKPELLSGAQPAPGICGSVFKGICDTDVGALVHGELRKERTGPRFVYWLTLTTHIPYVAKADGTLGCGTTGAPMANRTVCDLTTLWKDVFDAVARIAADESLPPTDILLVGDHHTPMWDRDARRYFSPGLVDWYFLKSVDRAPDA